MGSQGIGESHGAAATDPAETPTVVGDPATPAGLDSLIVLQRARARLLGRGEDPVRIGRYTIQRKLGVGGMGVVYEAYDSDLDRAVALKVLRTELGRDPERRDWLMDEAKALAKLSHPNVVHVYEVSRHEAQVYLAMELVEGKTLRAWVDDERPGWREILERYVQAAKGLIAAHEAGFVHRDFKPDNALVGADGRVRVLDFGLARPDLDLSTQSDTMEDLSIVGGDADPTMTATIVGTPAYMDPQRIAGRRADQSSDQFAFFVSLYEALHGCRPFQGSSSAELLQQMEAGALAPSRSKRSIPKRLHRAIMRGLAFAPADRHRDMRAAIVAIEKAARGTRTPWLLVGGVAAAAAAGALLLRDPPAEAATAESSAASVSSAWQQAIESAEPPTPIDAQLPDDPAGVTVHRLANGMTVYLAYRADRPRLTTRFVVRAGLAEETRETSGIAGLTSKAVVRGSQRLGTVDFAAEKPLLERHHDLLRQAVQAATQEERDRFVREAHEAYLDSAQWLSPRDADEARRELGIGKALERSGDGLVVGAEVPTTRFEAWARLMAEEVSAPVFRGFTEAAASRLGRLGWYYGGAEASVTMERLLAEVGAVAPDPDAEAALVRSFPLDAVMEFHRTFYVPNNTAIVIVGDIRPDEALPALEAAFGDWEPGTLPPRADVDVPWPNERRFAKVDTPRGRSVSVGFPLPPASDATRAAFEALEQTLGGQDGLLQTWAKRQDAVAGTGALMTSRGLILYGGVAPDATHDEVEAAVVGLVEAIAEERVEEEVWARAMAHRELRAAEWARSPDDLADRIAQFHVERRDWVEHARALDPSHVTKEDIVIAARKMLARGTAVVHAEPGEPWRPDETPLELPPVDTPETSEGSISPFGRELGELPVRELEPRFLIDGRHFERKPYGGAELITSQSQGPLFYATWVYPVGVRHDPYVCDAVRHRADRWSRDIDALASAHLGIRCGTTTTTFELTGVVDRVDEIMAGVAPVLSDTSLDPERLPKLVESTLATRRQLREDPMASASAFHAFALHRTASIDRWMPTDAELERASVERFERALATLTQPDPYVLIAGPDPGRIAAMLPAPRGTASTFELPTLAPPERSTVYLWAGGRPGGADARLSVVRSGIVDHTGTLAEAFVAGPPPGVSAARQASVGISLPTLFHFVAIDRPAHVWMYGGATPAVLEVVEAAMQELRDAAPTESMVALRSRLEDKYRLGRVPAGRIPDVVLGWGRGRTVDPRMETWAALGRLDDADLAGYYEAIAQQPVIVSVVVPPSEVDREALQALGTLEEPDPSVFLRDVNLTDTRVPGPR